MGKREKVIYNGMILVREKTMEESKNRIKEKLAIRGLIKEKREEDL